MLSFLIDKCGAEPSELPQLVKLNALMQAEEHESTTVKKATKPAPTAQDSTNAINTTTSKDTTMLGFLLDRCTTAEERVQCPMLQQMRGWLLQDENGASTNAAHITATSPPPPPPPSGKKNSADNIAAPHENVASAGAAVLQPPAPVMDIPVPILPGAGDWKGSITVYASPPPLPTQPPRASDTAPPPPPPSSLRPPPAAPANNGEAATAEQKGRQHEEKKEEEEAVPTGLTRKSEATGSPVLSSRVDPSHSADAAPTTQLATPPPEMGIAAATLAAAAGCTVPLRPHPPVPSYAGRMPCPASEALAVRNSATVRLLSNTAARKPTTASRPSSSIPPTSRPASGFAKRFMADLYNRVSTPRGGSGAHAGPAHVTAAAHSAAVPLAIGSGVRAAREHHHQQQHVSSPQPQGTGPWHAEGGAAAAPPSLQPPHFTPAPPTAGRRASGSEPRQRRPSLTRPVGHPSTVVLPGVAATGGRGVHRPGSAPRGQQPSRPNSILSGGSGGGDPLGLMVVGERIRLPSAPLARTRYA